MPRGDLCKSLISLARNFQDSCEWTFGLPTPVGGRPREFSAAH
jgi:hypothetical protein